MLYTLLPIMAYLAAYVGLLALGRWLVLSVHRPAPELPQPEPTEE